MIWGLVDLKKVLFQSQMSNHVHYTYQQIVPSFKYADYFENVNTHQIYS